MNNTRLTAKRLVVDRLCAFECDAAVFILCCSASVARGSELGPRTEAALRAMSSEDLVQYAP